MAAVGSASSPSAHATLSGTTVDTVTINSARSICVTNRDSTNTLWFTLDGVAPVAAANGTYSVLPNQAKSLDLSTAVSVVKVLGNGGGYSVEGI